MALTEQEAEWIVRFSAGAVQARAIGASPKKSKAEDLEEKLRRARDKEEVKEQALKDMLLEKTLRLIDKRREELRETTQATVEREDDGGKKKKEQLRDKDGKQQKATDTGNMKGVTKVTYGSSKGKDPSGSDVDTSGMTQQPPLDGGHDDVSAPFNVKKNTGPEAKGLKLLSESVAWVQAQADELGEVTVMRSTLPEGADDIVLAKQKLFTDKELTDEIFTPLVRDKVLGKTPVPDKYSKTQQMLDGSDDYYIKECKEKGRAPATGAAELTKGLIGVAGTVATTIFSGMGAVKEGQDAMNNANWSKDQVAEYNDITNGVVAVLQGAIDLTDKGIEASKTRDFESESAFSSVVSNIGTGLARSSAERPATSPSAASCNWPSIAPQNWSRSARPWENGLRTPRAIHRLRPCCPSSAGFCPTDSARSVICPARRPINATPGRIWAPASRLLSACWPRASRPRLSWRSRTAIGRKLSPSLRKPRARPPRRRMPGSRPTTCSTRRRTCRTRTAR